MSGIFFDPRSRRLRIVDGGKPDLGWVLVTHNREAGTHQCRRILRESFAAEELGGLDWTTDGQP